MRDRIDRIRSYSLGHLAGIVAIYLPALWVGVDFLALRDLSPFYSFYGTLGAGQVDTVAGALLVVGAIAGIYAIGSTRFRLERVGLFLAGVGWTVLGIGFALYAILDALGIGGLTEPPGAALTAFSHASPALTYFGMGVISIRAATMDRRGIT